MKFKNRNRGFTLTEMLVVIAIISLLSAIIFPVFARVKVTAYKDSDISSMNSLRTAIQLYRDDQGGYPPALLGYISPYEYRNGASVVPANAYRGPLFPRRVDSLETLRGSQNRAALSLLVPAAWPQADVRPVGSAPYRDLNGDGTINAGDDVALSRQAYATSIDGGTVNYFTNDIQASPNIGQSTDTTDTVVGRFYAVSGYDIGPVRYTSGRTENEVRYTLFWSGYGVTTGAPNDDPRQLGYSEPPADTVITWNTFFRDYRNNALFNGGSKDFVLYLNGSARPVDSKLVSERAWRLGQ